jgi:hypothetical protein
LIVVLRAAQEGYMSEATKVWIVGKRKIDGIAPGTPVEVDEHVAKRFIEDGVAESAKPPEAPPAPSATGNKLAPPKDEKPAK